MSGRITKYVNQIQALRVLSRAAKKSTKTGIPAVLSEKERNLVADLLSEQGLNTAWVDVLGEITATLHRMQSLWADRTPKAAAPIVARYGPGLTLMVAESPGEAQQIFGAVLGQVGSQSSVDGIHDWIPSLLAHLAAIGRRDRADVETALHELRADPEDYYRYLDSLYFRDGIKEPAPA